MAFEQIANPRQRAFLAAYSESGIIKLAAQAAGVDRSSHYDWKAQDAEYAEAFDLARQFAADALEDTARERAMTGKSDQMLMFLLRRLKPECYGTGRDENAGEVKRRHTVDLSALSDEELETLERIAQKTQIPADAPKLLVSAEEP